MKNVQVTCPACRGLMVLDEFDIRVDPKAGVFSVDGEIECPHDGCALVFGIENGEAVYSEPPGKR